MNNLTEKDIADILYNELDYVYCDNCRYNDQDEKDKYRERYKDMLGDDASPCEDCYRKYMQWEIGMPACEIIAKKILNIKKELD